VPTDRIRQTDLAWERSGSGPRLVFCNGSGSTLAEARLLLSALGEGFDVLAFDYRGLGGSAPSPGPYAMADLAGDVLGLMDHVGWDRARLCGMSFGGMVAQEVAVTAPDRIERLALLCTSAGGAGGASYPLHELEDLDPDERARRRRSLIDARFDETWLAAHSGDAALVDLIAQPDSGRPDDLAGRRAQMAARRDHDTWDRLGQITCPTLVAAGRYDPVAPMANSEALAGRIRGAELRAYEGGHLFLLQDRTAVPDIREFLARP
jgi:3-oxoadipate enol-lactonase